jgi:hypothetical protein
MIRRAAFHGASQLFQFGGKRLKLGNEHLGIEFGKVGRRIEQRIQHHCDARKDRLFDPIERLCKAGLLLLDIAHGRKHASPRVKKP